jgi:glutathione S-transferase
MVTGPFEATWSHLRTIVAITSAYCVACQPGQGELLRTPFPHTRVNADGLDRSAPLAYSQQQTPDKGENVIRLHDNLSSGNGYKARLLLAQLGIPFERVEYDIDEAETRTPAFLEKVNLNGRVPVLETEDGRFLPESNAILFYMSEGTAFIPDDRFGQAQVLQWMFFEQYSHEPNIATLRFWTIHNIEMNAERRLSLETKRKLGYDALVVMEGHLRDRSFFVGDRYSIADIALYAYTHVAHEGGFDLGRFPAVRAWLQRVTTQPGHILITQG